MATTNITLFEKQEELEGLMKLEKSSGELVQFLEELNSKFESLEKTSTGLIGET